MFGLEILLALILKFWTILYGLVYGSITSLPRLHRSLLARQLKVEWHEAEYLIVQSADRDLHIADLTVITLVGGRGHVAFRERDTLLLQGQTLRIPVDPISARAARPACTVASNANAGCCRHDSIGP